MSFRVGNKLGTTIYIGEQEQPVGWFPNLPELAELVVELLNIHVKELKAAVAETLENDKAPSPEG